jgi:hypothetical protein
MSESHSALQELRVPRDTKCLLAAFLTVLLLAFAARAANAQLPSPRAVKNATAQSLQRKHLDDLKAIGVEIEAHQFPYHFYLNRTLDINEGRQMAADQRAIRFEKYDGQVVLAVTGNYFAAYSSTLMDKDQRAKKTMEDVVLPILRAAVPRFAADDSFSSFAIEVSHHVRGKLVGISMENPENLMFVFPRAAAQHLISANTPEQMQEALLDSKVFLDAEPLELWVSGPPPDDAADFPKARQTSHPQAPALRQAAMTDSAPAPVLATVSAKLLKPSADRLVTPQTLTDLKLSHADAVARLAQGLASQAHLVPYAPPDFIGFHGGAYLQLSLQTDLELIGEASRYKRAALAFDDHISHLIRPSLAYFQGTADFDGISFSTTLKQSGNSSAQAVEFYFPFNSMDCYARYDCTGQALIDSGLVLINGERVTLNLEVAETPTRN